MHSHYGTWYGVDGVGAGSGVAEIEEGEDAIEKEDQPFKSQTKNEKNCCLAKERKEKRVKRELELKQRHTSLRVEHPTSSTASSAFPDNSPATISIDHACQCCYSS